MNKKATNPSKIQLENRIKNAQLIVDKGSDYKAFFFGDRGIGVYVCEDYTITTTLFHQHVWNNVTSSGFSNPYAFLKRFVEIANENKDSIVLKDKEGNPYYSIDKLKSLASLSNEEHLLCIMCDRFICINESAVYDIGNDSVTISALGLEYMHFLSKANAYMEIGDDKDCTRLELISKYISIMRSLSIDTDYDNDDFQSKVEEIENEALERIKKLISDSGKTINDTVIINKRTDGKEEGL